MEDFRFDAEDISLLRAVIAASSSSMSDLFNGYRTPSDLAAVISRTASRESLMSSPAGKQETIRHPGDGDAA